MSDTIEIRQAQDEDLQHVQQICQLIESAARARGTGIAKRNPDYIAAKINNGQAVIALDHQTLAGFCYIETWDHGEYVANSGLVVNPDYRKGGLGRKIKQTAFTLSRTLFPSAKLFGITTSLAVMKINSDLGYEPVTFSELTRDKTFWNGCQSCPNFDVLQRTKRTMCLCTGMLYHPEADSQD